jgi:hypothetical protein
VSFLQRAGKNGFCSREMLFNPVLVTNGTRCWIKGKGGETLGVIQMRYYFHVLGVGRTYKDDEGMACKNAEHAKGHAQFMAYELFRLLGAEFRSDQRVTAISVLVTDEMGNEITRAPLRLRCAWLH